MKLDQEVLERISELIERIESIKWFTSCGEQVGDSAFRLKYVNSWDEAKKYYSSIEWENTQLEAQNELTVFLHRTQKDKYQDWNEIVREAKKYIEGPFIEKMRNEKTRFNLDEDFINNVKWDILAAIMEHVYLEYRGSVFYLHLLEIYESGHLPCGWNGEWPEGELMIF